ncbi:hypothetical protein [Pseudoalteromonas sp. SR43-2]|uniref:hypothetical protein n=1 Tax=Pseudoalteromonas TaxID=53246 RepID=UPI0015FA3752|nr:hypothetical protein [Pseudoalteromonas sp. SR43-2]MBB1379090.1 hypothetical protein [Pseudoalteromonas sp. SR43-2]
MSLITTSILMLFLQPLFVYLALFKESDRSTPSRSLDNEDAMYLFIAPGLAVFYSDEFWQAVLYLGSVCLLGLMLAIIVKSKAKKRLTRDDAIGFTIASFLFFGIIKLIIGGLGYFFSENAVNASAPVIGQQTYSSTTGELLNWGYLYYQFWPTLYFLLFMLATLVIKIIESRFNKHSFSGSLLILGAVLAGVSPLFGHAFILGVIANFFIFFVVCTACIEIDKRSDPSAGAISFIYGFLLVGGIAFSSFGKLIYTLFYN